MTNKKSYRICYHKVEGNIKEVLSELIQEKIKSALSANGRNLYYDFAFYVSNYITGVMDNAESSDLCKGID